MAKLIGLAFTSPGVTILSIDRNKYRTFYYERNTLSDFRLFLQQEDSRLPVVLVKNVRHLQELASIDTGVECFILFEDPKVLQNIKGAILPDFEPSVNTEWTKKLVPPDYFNALLENKEGHSFEITEKALLSSSEMSKEITFEELIKVVKNQYQDIGKEDSNFVQQACKYIVKLVNKKSWVASGRKPALADGLSVKTIAELEKFIETSKTADELWRAFYDYTTNKTEISKLVDMYKIAKQDIEFLLSNIEINDSLQFDAVPGASKRKKQSRTKKQG